MPYTQHRSASFGPGKAAVTTWGYRLYDAVAATYATRVTAGIVRSQDPNGNYTGWVSADVVIPDGFRGKIVFDTGEALTPVPTAEEEINPGPENADVKTSSRGTSTYSGGPVASVAAPVTLTGAYDAAKFALPASSYTPPDNATLGYLGALLTGDHSRFTTVALAGAPVSPSYVPVGTVVTGSSPSVVVVSGLPAGRSYVGQHLWHASGESRLIGTQSYAGGNYTFTIAPTLVLPGAFTAVTAGDAVRPTP